MPMPYLGADSLETHLADLRADIILSWDYDQTLLSMN